MVLAITITATSAAITIINIRGNNGYSNGQTALANAETGIENALLQLERDPNYTGETLSLASGNTTTSVTGTSTKTITAIGTAGQFKRTVVATATYSGSIITLTSWTETP